MGERRPAHEASETSDCLGTVCTIAVLRPSAGGEAGRVVAELRQRLQR